MKILKFRIRNYKSIMDSRDCYLTDKDNITILAGRNECGKTAILEALEDFNFDRIIRDEAKPIVGENLIPEIEVTFKVPEDILKEILKKAGLVVEIDNDRKIKIIKDREITIIKKFPKEYTLNQKSVLELGLNGERKKTINKIGNLFKKIKESKGKYPALSSILPELDFNNINNLLTKFNQFNQEVVNNISTVTDENDRSNILKNISEIIRLSENIQKNINTVEVFLKEFTESYLPNFILFSSFEDEFPHTIPISELNANEWSKDLTKISNFSPETILSGSPYKKIEHRTNLNIELKGKFEKYWNQDPIYLEIEWDSDTVYFWIKEKGHFYEPRQRSKGQQWHLAFFVKVGARINEDNTNIILIDEPGLFLHAKAQKDVLLILEDLSQDSQIIFSTHSPYLIEYKNLPRVRLVIKEENGEKNTKIYGKIHARADKETLTPILTAIGLGLNDGIQDIGKIKNVVVEGPSDVFYLQAFKELFKKIERAHYDINFIFGGGAGNMPFVGTILQGWGCEVIYLYDNDQGKKDGKKNLKDNWFVTKEQILSVLDEKGAIEDIFIKEDFIKHVLVFLEVNEIKNGTSNSEYVKEPGKDEVLLAMQFLQKVKKEKIKMDDKTLENISNLFEKINELFNQETENEET